MAGPISPTQLTSLSIIKERLLQKAELWGFRFVHKEGKEQPSTQISEEQDVPRWSGNTYIQTVELSEGKTKQTTPLATLDAVS